MSKRNFILLTIVLVIIVLGFFGYLYFKGHIVPGEDGEGTNFISQFNPFGNGTGTNNPDGTAPPVDVSGYEPPLENEALRLMRVSSMPVAGYAVFPKERLKEVALAPLLTEEEIGGSDTPLRPSGTPPSKGGEKTKPAPPATEFAPALRYVDRATGHVYQTFADKIEERKFSGTTIPKVYEAFFGNGGNAVLMRYLKSDGLTIQTFWGVLPKEELGGDSSGDIEIRGTFLPDNTRDLSLSPDAMSVFYLFETGESIVGTTLNFSTGKKVQVFDSAFTEWLSSWPKNSFITLATKPSSAVPGYLYKVDTLGKNFAQIMGKINGLTALASPRGDLVLYSDSSLSLSVYNVDTKETNSLGIRTLPEKCVWGKTSELVYCSVPVSIPSFSYPDAWYRGEVSFEDQIWKIDVAEGSSAMIADVPAIDGGEQIDGVKLSLDDGENYLFFVNKRDSFLWKLNLK